LYKDSEEKVLDNTYWIGNFILLNKSAKFSRSRRGSVRIRSWKIKTRIFIWGTIIIKEINLRGLIVKKIGKENKLCYIYQKLEEKVVFK